MHISIEIMRIKPERNDYYLTHGILKKNCDFFFQIKSIIFAAFNVMYVVGRPKQEVTCASRQWRVSCQKH